MRIKILLIAALLFLGVFAPASVFALASSSWDQTIELAVPLRDKLVDFSMEDPSSGDGSEPNPYTTYTSDISLSVTVAGPGIIIVTDEAGNIIYSFTKTSSGTETFTFDTTLANGVGLYKLTAVFVDLSDPNNIYDSKSIYVSYLPTTIIPTPPEPPRTGVFYLGNRAFLVQDLVSVILAAGIITFLSFIIMGRRKNTQK
jgi:hypothetical protein